MEGICNITKGRVKGFILLKDTKRGCKIDVQLRNVKEGYHGFHIHQFGDLRDGCNSLGSHYNPHLQKHGGIDTKHRHKGDLGNIYNTKPYTSGTKIVSSNVLNINKCNKNSIIGRSIIVHKDKDDLGKGGNQESLKTGNAGARLACGIIGISK